MQALLNHDLMTLRKVIKPSAHRSVPPVDRMGSLRIRCGLVNAVRVIHHYIVTAFSRSGGHRHDDAITRSVVFKTVFLVLIPRQLVAVGPALLVPVALDQASAFETVPLGQWRSVTAEQPSGRGMIDPNPCRPENRDQQRLCVPGRNIDD